MRLVLLVDSSSQSPFPDVSIYQDDCDGAHVGATFQPPRPLAPVTYVVYLGIASVASRRSFIAPSPLRSHSTDSGSGPFLVPSSYNRHIGNFVDSRIHHSPLFTAVNSPSQVELFCTECTGKVGIGGEI
jgi:hypothetical protein